jgi:hypothetical protein
MEFELEKGALKYQTVTGSYGIGNRWLGKIMFWIWFRVWKRSENMFNF